MVSYVVPLYVDGTSVGILGTDLAEYNNGELSKVKDFLADASNQDTTFQYSYNGTDKYLTFTELDNGMKLVMSAPLG